MRDYETINKLESKMMGMPRSYGMETYGESMVQFTPEEIREMDLNRSKRTPVDENNREYLTK